MSSVISARGGPYLRDPLLPVPFLSASPFHSIHLRVSFFPLALHSVSPPRRLYPLVSVAFRWISFPPSSFLFPYYPANPSPPTSSSYESLRISRLIPRLSAYPSSRHDFERLSAPLKYTRTCMHTYAYIRVSPITRRGKAIPFSILRTGRVYEKRSSSASDRSATAVDRSTFFFHPYRSERRSLIRQPTNSKGNYSTRFNIPRVFGEFQRRPSRKTGPKIPTPRDLASTCSTLRYILPFPPSLFLFWPNTGPLSHLSSIVLFLLFSCRSSEFISQIHVAVPFHPRPPRNRPPFRAILPKHRCTSGYSTFH